MSLPRHEKLPFRRVRGRLTCPQPPYQRSLTKSGFEGYCSAGVLCAVVWQRTADEQWRELLESSLMAIDGRWECVDGVRHLIVQRMQNFGSLMLSLRPSSRDFH